MKKNKYGFWKGFIPVVLAGALGFGAVESCGRKSQSLENISQGVQTSESQKNSGREVKERERLRELEDRYGFLDVYNQIIDENIRDFSTRLGLNDLERNWFKAQIFEEAGSEKDRESAFKFDPMQIANQGDYALRVLSSEGENTNLIGDFSCLKEKRNTPRKFRIVKVKGKKGKVVEKREYYWDYSESNMDAASSIFGGIGWLLHYRAKVNRRVIEEGEILEYEIKARDTFFDIAKRIGTTTSTLIKYNPQLKPEGLQVGQKVRYRISTEERYISGWGPVEDVIRKYNGQGNPNYLERVSLVKKELDELEGLREKFRA